MARARCRARCTRSRPRDARHAYAVLAGLTSAGGGMVAAATTSLPERARGGPQLRLPLRLDPRPVLRRAGRRAAGPLSAAGRRGALRHRSGCWQDGPELKPAYTRPAADRCPTSDRTATCPATRAAPTSSATGSTSSSSSTSSARRCCFSPPPPSHDRLDPDGWRAAELAVGRDRPALARSRTRRRDLGARPRRVDAQPADLRRRAAPDRRSTAPPASRPRVGLPRRRRSSPTQRARAAPVRPLAARARRSPASTPRCCWPRSAARIPAD